MSVDAVTTSPDSFASVPASLASALPALLPDRRAAAYRAHVAQRLLRRLPRRRAGIEIGERVNIPDALIPADARVEMDAKMAAGYFTPGHAPDADELKKAKGRELDT